MQNYEKLSAVRKLVDIADGYGSLEEDVVKLIDKVVSPLPPALTVLSPSHRQPISPTLDELLLARQVGKISAIKAYRTRTGFVLKEAKDNIEKAFEVTGWLYGNGSTYTQYKPIFEDIEPIPF